MDDVRLGSSIRAIRIRRGWRQEDLARRAGASRSTVARIERGELEGVSLSTLRPVVRALNASFEVRLRWHGGDLDRLVNARHAAMHESLARRFSRLPGWTLAPEVSFSVYGERGIIDAIAWHEATRTLLVIELKTELVDMSDLVGTMDRRRRLAPTIARGRGLLPAAVGTLVLVAESRTNRRRLAEHATMLRTAFPADGRRVRRWINRPRGRIDALGFLPDDRAASVRRGMASVRRVNPARGDRTARPASTVQAAATDGGRPGRRRTEPNAHPVATGQERAGGQERARGDADHPGACDLPA